MDDLETNMVKAWADQAGYWMKLFQAVANAPGLIDLNYVRDKYANATTNMRKWEI